MTGMKCSLVALLFLSLTTTAIAKHPSRSLNAKQLEANQRYVVLPGTRLVAGDVAKNEFFILGAATKPVAVATNRALTTETKQVSAHQMKRDKIALVVKRAMHHGKSNDLLSAHSIKKTVVKKAKPHRLAQKNKSSIKLKKMHANKSVKMTKHAKKVLVAVVKKKHNVSTHG